jgi:hypothetical protein
MGETSSDPRGSDGTAEKPNPWDVVNDYSKTVITLASALLALTATFGNQLLTPSSNNWQRGLLAAALFLLVVTIVSGVFAEAFLTTFLRGKAKTGNACLAWSLVALYSLIAAMLCFFGSAVGQLLESRTDIVSVTEKATRTLDSIARIPGAKWSTTSVTLDSARNRYVYEIREETTASRFEVISDSKTGLVVAQKRIAP